MKSIFSNSNKIGDKFKTVLSNRGLLYILFALSIGNLFYLGSENDIMTIAIFILTGFLTSFFSKNMVVILSIALVVSSIIRYGVSVSSEEEGFSISEGLSPDEKDKVRAAVEGLLGDPKKPSKKGGNKPRSNDENEPEEEEREESEESEERENFDDREDNFVTEAADGNTRVSKNTISGNTTAGSGRTSGKKGPTSSSSGTRPRPASTSGNTISKK